MASLPFPPIFPSTSLLFSFPLYPAIPYIHPFGHFLFPSPYLPSCPRILPLCPVTFFQMAYREFPANLTRCCKFFKEVRLLHSAPTNASGARKTEQKRNSGESGSGGVPTRAQNVVSLKILAWYLCRVRVLYHVWLTYQRSSRAGSDDDVLRLLRYSHT